MSSSKSNQLRTHRFAPASERRIHHAVKRVVNLIEESETERGEENEIRFEKICNERQDKPSWMLHATDSSYEEDINGVDVWLHTTDAGRIPFQVKSCENGRIRFEQECPIGYVEKHRPIAIVVEPNRSDELIWMQILARATHIRNLRLSTQAKSA